MSTADLVNHQIRLASRPVGLPNASNWSHTTETVTGPAEGGVLVKTWRCRLTPPCGAG